MRNPYVALLKTAWKYARLEKRRFVLIYSMFVAANIIVALNPLLYGWFINELQLEGTAVLSTGWIYVAGFMFLRLAEWIFHGPARVMERQLAFTMSKNFLDELFNKVLHLPVSWHQENHSGSTINKLRKAYEALRDFFQHGFIYLYSFGKFFFSFLAMLYFSPLFGTIGVLLGVVTILMIVRFDRPFITTHREVNRKEHEVSSTLFDSLSNILTVITLRLENRIRGGLMSKVGEVFPPFKKNATINEWKWFSAQMMVGLIYAVTTIGYVYQHYTPGETFMIGGLIILLGYVTQFTSVFNDIASHYTQIVRYDTDVQNARELEKAFDNKIAKNEPLMLPAGWKQLDIRGLTFTRNENRDSKASGIRDISIQIRNGKRIALIGESGSGKSTLLSVLRGLNDAAPGWSMTADNHLPVNPEGVASTVTLFPQEPEIFESSVLYNLTLGLPFTEEEVMRVCEEAHFADVVRRLPGGLHTHIQEKGVNLSGGQKQRLALARGILAARSSSIVLMDEPTSSVDPVTEKKIYAKLFSAFQNKAVISSLHRLHLLPDFDYIYILREGSVIDEGTFYHLAKYSLVFKEMLAHQAAVTDVDGKTDEEFPALNVAL